MEDRTTVLFLFIFFMYNKQDSLRQWVSSSCCGVHLHLLPFVKGVVQGSTGKLLADKHANLHWGLCNTVRVFHPYSRRATVAVCSSCHPSSKTDLKVTSECSFHFLNANTASHGFLMDLLHWRMSYNPSLCNMDDLLVAGGSREWTIHSVAWWVLAVLGNGGPKMSRLCRSSGSLNWDMAADISGKLILHILLLRYVHCKLKRFYFPINDIIDTVFYITPFLYPVTFKWQMKK